MKPMSGFASLLLGFLASIFSFASLLVSLLLLQLSKSILSSARSSARRPLEGEPRAVHFCFRHEDAGSPRLDSEP
jgi:hypothetical protein